MRDRLDAPLAYHNTRRGYYYRDDSFRLPPLFATERQLVALLLARQLLKTDGSRLDRDLGKFAETLLGSIADRRLSPRRLDDLFSAIWSGHAPASPNIFKSVLRALTQEKILTFDYKSPAAGEYNRRTAEPHHLQYYQGSWFLLAWCFKAQDWRKFYLSRMGNASITNDIFTPRPKTEWQHHLEGAFGIYQGSDHIRVRLKFSASRAPWIQEQKWHEKQEMKLLSDGALELTLPVADLREIHLRVLQYGPDVEVIEPEELREMIKEDIGRMMELYGTKTPSP